MTNHWIDIKNADVVLIMGSNAAENHPISFKWVIKAKEERGAKLIVVDPRFTKSAALADLYAPLRPGSDLAFLNGIVNYALQNDLVQKEYVVEYTNAAYLVSPEYGFRDGLFSGYNPAERKYDNKSWKYQLDAKGIPKRDKTLKDPQCVYQLMKSHYGRYTPEKVEAATGCPRGTFLKVAELFCSTHKRDRVATIMYAMGTTQHTVGTQNVRVYALLQLLMGNMGLAGGGINALRGESNVQGSTDAGLLFHLLPGYLPAPNAKKHQGLEAYLKDAGVVPVTNDPMSINWKKNFNKYIISMLKAWYGDAAKEDNEYCFNWLPKYVKPAPFIVLFDDMYKGMIKGAFYMGTNPVVGGPDSNRIARAMQNLDWLVAADLWETDSSIFWKREGVNPALIKTEVFMLPAASSVEKEGSVSNSGRWAQWRYKAVQAPGVAKSDLDMIDMVFRELRELYRKEGGRFPDPIVKSNWDYIEPGEHEASPRLVAREANGYEWKSRKQLPAFFELKEDGSTACGDWIYSGSYTEEGNMMARRGLKDPARPGHVPRVDVVLAGEQEDHLQPGGGRPERRTLGRETVGRQVDRQQVEGGRGGRGPALRAGGEKSLHHERRGRGQALRAQRSRGRPAYRALRAVGKPDGEHIQLAAAQSRLDDTRFRRRRIRRSRALPLHRHVVPGGGALAGRRHDAQPAVADGARARHVLRDKPVAGRRKGNQQRRQGAHPQLARQHQRLRPGDQPGPAPEN